MAIKARTYSDARAQAKSNPELAWWVFMRLSGVFLVVLSFFHLFKNYIITSELSWDYEAVAASYSFNNPENVWNRLYLLALLVLGLMHGANGLRYVLDDATSRSPVARFWMKSVAYTVIGVILVFGLLALFSNPCQPGINCLGDGQ
jgi:succinate dehydrogenase / fumarate reductase, membrane anchor subunit